MRPWEYHPAITKDRLVKLVQLIELGRNDAVDRHEPEIGDDGWTRGVRAYNCARYQISRAAGTSGLEWLSVIERGRKFQFAVGGVPFRFWRGDANEPPTKISTATAFEQLFLDLGPDSPLSGAVFRIGITADEEGALLSACFAAIRGDVTETVWPISLAGAEPLIVSLSDERPEGRELDEPSIGELEDYEAEENQSRGE